MKYKTLLIVLVINAFAMLLVSVVREYNNMDTKIVRVEQTVSSSIEAAIDASMTSEELFSQKYQAGFSSYGTSSSASLVSSSVLLYDEVGKSWYTGNSFVLAQYYDKYGVLPSSEGAYNAFSMGAGAPDTTESVYEFLYGDATTRVPTPNFKSFYDAIGNDMLSLKVRNGTSYVFPTLTQMGLNLAAENNGSAPYSSDVFTTVAHTGKAPNGLGTTQYYYTPYSLGVTYIPIEVLKPTFLVNLNSLVRLQMASDLDFSSGADLDEAMEKSDGCVETIVNLDRGQSVLEEHVLDTGEDIINDGLVEYDLNSTQVKVDYLNMDLWDTKNAVMLVKLKGVSGWNPEESAGKTAIVQAYKDLDTGYQTSRDKATYESAVGGNKIVARVTVRIKVHIPYQSAVIQWACYNMSKGTGEANHYDVKSWDGGDGKYIKDSNGVWFQYTTYRALMP